MAHYYASDWVDGTPTFMGRSEQVSWVPAVAASGVVLLAVALIALFFPAGAGNIEDAVVYINSGGGHGSGIVTNSRLGYILTNRHVVMDEKTRAARARTFKVTLYRGTDHERTVDASVRDFDHGWSPSDDPLGHDWAILQTTGEQPRVAARFSNSLALAMNTKVHAWGFPQTALEQKVVSSAPGEVTGLDRPRAGALYSRIKHSASLAGGNSGGPLVLADGSVVGVNAASDVVGNTTSGGGNGAAPGNSNYAIPTHVLEASVLKKYASFYH